MTKPKSIKSKLSKHNCHTDEQGENTDSPGGEDGGLKPGLYITSGGTEAALDYRVGTVQISITINDMGCMAIQWFQTPVLGFIQQDRMSLYDSFIQLFFYQITFPGCEAYSFPPACHHQVRLQTQGEGMWEAEW